MRGLGSISVLALSVLAVFLIGQSSPAFSQVNQFVTYVLTNEDGYLNYSLIPALPDLTIGNSTNYWLDLFLNGTIFLGDNYYINSDGNSNINVSWSNSSLDLDCVDCVTLGNETTGDYVATISDANPISILGGGSGEGSTPIISLLYNSTHLRILGSKLALSELYAKGSAYDYRFYTQTQINSLLLNYYNKTESDNLYYNQTYLDSEFAKYYNITEIDTFFANYYNITESDARYYTQTYLDVKFLEYYNITEIDTMLQSYYNTTEIDSLLSVYYNITQIDEFFTNYYNTTEIENLLLNYYNKTESDERYRLVTNEISWANLTDYPTGCLGGQAVQVINDTLTCISVGGGSGVANVTGNGVAYFIPLWYNESHLITSIMSQNSSKINVYGNVTVRDRVTSQAINVSKLYSPDGGTIHYWRQIPSDTLTFNFSTQRFRIQSVDNHIRMVMFDNRTDSNERAFAFKTNKTGSDTLLGISYPGDQLASHFSRSLMVGSTTNNCSSAGYLNISCDTDSTGADLGVDDDLEVKDDAFIQDDLFVVDDISIGFNDIDNDRIRFNGNTENFRWDASDSIFVLSDAFRPSGNLRKDLGTPNHAWDNVYADDFITLSEANSSIDPRKALTDFKIETVDYGTYSLERMNHSSLPEWTRTVQVRDNEGNLTFDKNGNPVTRVLEHGVSINRLIFLLIEYAKAIDNDVTWINKTGQKASECPRGFVTYGLGCIQNSEQGIANTTTANDQCYDRFEGRLPSAQEIETAFRELPLVGKTDDIELTGDIDFGLSGIPKDRRCIYLDGRIGVDGFGATSCNFIGSYRCFVPFGNLVEGDKLSIKV